MRDLSTRMRGLVSGDFLRHGLLVFGSSMLVNVLGYAYHFAISRRIGVEQYGVLSALNAGFMISAVVGGIGTTVVVKYAAEFRALDDRAHLAALVRRLGTYGLLAGAIVMLAGIACAPWIGAYLKVANVTAVALTMVLIGFSVVTPCLRGVFVGTEDFTRFSISTVIESALKAICGIGLVYAGFGVQGAFAGWAIGSLVAFVYTVTTLRGRYRRVPDATLYVDVRRLARTTANVAIATFLIASISYADVLVVKHYADPTEAGLYGALSLSGKILLFLVGFVPTVVLPKATRQAMSGVSPVGVFKQALSISAAFSAAGLLVYYFFPTTVVTALAGASFAPAAPFVFGYGLAMVLLAGLNLVVVYKIGIHRFDFVAPLAICTIGELVGMALHHRTLGDVILVLLVGNALAFLGCAYRVTAPLASRTRLSAAPDAA